MVNIYLPNSKFLERIKIVIFLGPPVFSFFSLELNGAISVPTFSFALGRRKLLPGLILILQNPKQNTVSILHNIEW